MRAHSWLYYVAIGVMVAVMITLACVESARRTAPLNLILLGVFTLCEGFMMGTISTVYSVEAILIAVGITTAVAFFLTIFAFQTKIDFTNCGGTKYFLRIIKIIRNNLYFRYALRSHGNTLHIWHPLNISTKNKV